MHNEEGCLSKEKSIQELMTGGKQLVLSTQVKITIDRSCIMDVTYN